MDKMDHQGFEETQTGYGQTGYGQTGYGQIPETVPMRQMDKDNSSIHEESATRYSGGGHFPEDLPERPTRPPAAGAPWKQRLRSFFTFSLSSYSIIHTPDGAARIRHLAMIATLLLRTAMSVLSILAAIWKKNIAGIIIYSLLAVMSFWFTATCLAIIGDAEGDKRLKSLVVKRIHFDIFLGACVVIHAGLIVAFFFGLSGWGLELTSVGMWFAILAVAWVAGWQPDLPRYQRTWVS